MKKILVIASFILIILLFSIIYCFDSPNDYTIVTNPAQFTSLDSSNTLYHGDVLTWGSIQGAINYELWLVDGDQATLLYSGLETQYTLGQDILPKQYILRLYSRTTAQVFVSEISITILATDLPPLSCSIILDGTKPVIELQWDPLESSPDLPYTYNIYYTADGSTPDLNSPSIQDVSPGYIFRETTLGVTYTFALQAVNSIQAIDTLQIASINIKALSGNLSYIGSLVSTGDYVIELHDTSDFSNDPLFTRVLTAEGSYIVYADNGTYYLRAYRDYEDDRGYDETYDPADSITSGIVVDDAGVTGLDLELEDPAEVFHFNISNESETSINISNPSLSMDIQRLNQWDNPSTDTVLCNLSASNGSISLSPSNVSITGTLTGQAITFTAGQGSTTIQISYNSEVGESVSIDVDMEAPEISSSDPAANSSIHTTQTIVLNFDEPMDTGTLSVGGSILSLPGDVDTTWTGNQQVSIAPSIAWETGSQTLQISCQDAAGNDLSTDPWAINFVIKELIMIDGANDVGQYTSIAVDGSNLYISYYDVTNGDLKFAKSTDGGDNFNVSTVDSIGDVGKYTSLAVNGSSIYISYYDETNQDLKFAKSTDSGDSFSSIMTVDSAQEVGQYTDIAVEGTNIYISYYSSVSSNLKLAHSSNDGVDWMAPNGKLTTVDSAGEVGQYTSLAVEGTSLYISYYDITNQDLKFAYSSNNGLLWDTYIVDDTGDTGQHTSLVLYAGSLYLTYYDITDGELWIARSTDNGATWPTKIAVDTSGNVGQYSSLFYGTNLYASYYDADNADLKFARSNDGGGTWGTVLTIASGGQVGKYTSLAANGSNLYVSYYDETNGDLMLARSSDEGNNW